MRYMQTQSSHVSRAGLRYRDSQEGHLEHRHQINKDFIDICMLRHEGPLPSDQRELTTDDSTHDNVVRTRLLDIMYTQMARMVKSSPAALTKTTLSSKQRMQFREDVGIDTSVVPTHDDDDEIDVDHEEDDEVDADSLAIEDAVADELLDEERIREMGLGHMLETVLSRPEPNVKCSLISVACGRDCVEWKRGVTGLHIVVSPSSDALMVVFSDRVKDKLRGRRRNGAIQKMLIAISSLWSAWITTVADGSTQLNLALSSAPACMWRMWTGNDNWVRRDDRHRLADVTTCNIVTLKINKQEKAQEILNVIHAAHKRTIVQVPAGHVARAVRIQEELVVYFYNVRAFGC